MTSATDRRSRLFYVVLFASLFAAISWLGPAAYYQFSPAESHVSIEGTDVSVVDNETHQLEITYDARARYPVEAEITLYEQTNDTKAKIESWKFGRFVEQGRHTTSLTLELSDALEPGTYVYEIDVVIHADYNVDKQYTHQTDTITVVAENTTNSSVRQTPARSDGEFQL